MATLNLEPDCLPGEWLDSVSENNFPQLDRGHYCVTSTITGQYNCIAWAAGENWRWWWPIPQTYSDPIHQWPNTKYYWPQGAGDEATMENFIRAYELIGYTVCHDSRPERGFEKIAIYVDANRVPTHAARQLKSGQWTSKLGECQDIRHDTPEVLESAIYGTVGRIMRRSLPKEGNNQWLRNLLQTILRLFPSQNSLKS